MKTLDIVLYIVAAAAFALALLRVQIGKTNTATVQVNLVALGLLAWVLVPLITLIRS